MIMKWIFGTSAVVGVATLALGLILVSTGSPATGNPDDTRNLASTLVTDGDGTSEGIQVHGDWTIEVSDPDGTLVEKREFKNKFYGAETIEKILTREKRASLWMIVMRQQIWTLPDGTPANYKITEPTWTGDQPNENILAKNLIVSGEGDGKVILQAEFTVTEAMSNDTGMFGGVDPYNKIHFKTSLALCGIEATTSDCLSPSHSGIGDFTSTDSEAPEAEEGQKINLTVIISFE